MKYILDNEDKPVPEPDPIKWSEWFHANERRVDSTSKDGIQVSTVFLGLNHAYTPDQPPLVWETMVFGGQHDEHQEKCSGSRRDAEAMHQRVVAMVWPKGQQKEQP